MFQRKDLKYMSELNHNGSPRNTESQPFFWNVDQAAKKAGVSPNTLRRMAQLPGFPKLTLGGKFYIPAKAFQNWVENDCYKQGNGLTEPHRAR